MKNREEITCPKLKAKKKKEKEKREQERRDRAINNFYKPNTNKKAPIKVKQSAFSAIHLHTEEEQDEAATLLQSHVRRCIAQAQLFDLRKRREQALKEIAEIKAQNPPKKQSRKQRIKKKRTQTEKVYFEAPTDC
tara:strand:- start:175 stop:579 length:405 start_codon:yes stop_codon:yes gene_type:complete